MYVVQSQPQSHAPLITFISWVFNLLLPIVFNVNVRAYFMLFTFKKNNNCPLYPRLAELIYLQSLPYNRKTRLRLLILRTVNYLFDIHKEKRLTILESCFLIPLPIK
jgi:hypothetical protein